jgi:hypothetical protein
LGKTIKLSWFFVGELAGGILNGFLERSDLQEKKLPIEGFGLEKN